MKEKVIALLKEGMKPKDIVKKLKCSESLPYVTAMRIGMKIRPKKGRQETIAEFSRKFGVKKACEKFECSKKTVYMYRTRYK